LDTTILPRKSLTVYLALCLDNCVLYPHIFCSYHRHAITSLFICLSSVSLDSRKIVTLVACKLSKGLHITTAALELGEKPNFVGFTLQSLFLHWPKEHRATCIAIPSSNHLVARRPTGKPRSMGVPTKPITAIAAAATYLLVTYQPNYLLSSNPTFAGTFVLLWALQITTWALYKVILYPRYISPLRHLPGPPVCNLETKSLDEADTYLE